MLRLPLAFRLSLIAAVLLSVPMTSHAQAPKPKKVKDGETAVINTTFSEADAVAKVKGYFNSKDLSFTVNPDNGKIVTAWHHEHNCHIISGCADQIAVRVARDGDQVTIRVQVFERQRAPNEPWIERSESNGKETAAAAAELEAYIAK